MMRANVIGSGPNGLSAAIVLAQAGLDVDVFEAEAQPGGGARTLPLTLPGFMHDFGSAVHPMAAASPFFASLPLADLGLHWIHGDWPLAHPLDDGSAVLLERNLADMDRQLGPDAQSWCSLLSPIVSHWEQFAEDSLGPVVQIPHHPFLMARFGVGAFQSANRLADHSFTGPRARALFAGLAAHSFLSLDQPLSSAVALVLGAAAHVVGWPIPHGGAQAITQALIAQLQNFGGKLYTSRRIDAPAFHEIGGGKTLSLFDTSPSQLLRIAGDLIPPRRRGGMLAFQPGPGVFKIDFALSAPVPWTAKECSRAISIHLGGTFEEIAESEDAVARVRHSEKPFVLVAQPSLFDPTRAPVGKHVLWAYCHVPNGSTVDMTTRIEAQIERFAPGFRDCILAKKVLSPAVLESMNANLVGGDISGGAMTMGQFLFRPTVHYYSTGNRNLYLCSSSTSPGGGVHGMCGFNAAKLALRRLAHLPK
jgi:phytoene dehydrogenase-like protein